jgi:hypothetical protein
MVLLPPGVPYIRAPWPAMPPLWVMMAPPLETHDGLWRVTSIVCCRPASSYR